MSTPSPIPVGHFADIAPVAGAPQRIHYHDTGEGPVVIFLHGAGGGASGYSNFKGNYPEFARAGYRCIVPDMLGFGLSSKPDIPMYDLDFFVAGVKGLVDALGLKDITLLGNSLGGAVSLGYALAYPDDVRRMMLMAPGGVEDIDTYLAMPGIANTVSYTHLDVYKRQTGAEQRRALVLADDAPACPADNHPGPTPSQPPIKELHGHLQDVHQR